LGYRFFFVSTREYIDEQFPNLSKTGGDAKATIAAKSTIAGYGWLNSVYSVAKDNIFTLPTHNAIDSVLLTDLYAVLTYLSWTNACNEYERAYNKLNK
jgi:hypothetical protein